MVTFSTLQQAGALTPDDDSSSSDNLSTNDHPSSDKQSNKPIFILFHGLEGELWEPIRQWTDECVC